MTDAQIVLKLALGIAVDVEIDSIAANVDGEEGISLNDASMVLKAALGIMNL